MIRNMRILHKVSKGPSKLKSAKLGKTSQQGGVIKNSKSVQVSVGKSSKRGGVITFPKVHKCRKCIFFHPMRTLKQNNSYFLSKGNSRTCIANTETCAPYTCF